MVRDKRDKGENKNGVDKRNNYVVIMAGGGGTRLWPYSRVSKPKQFLDVVGTGKTLIQATYERMLAHTDPTRVLVVTHERYATFVKEQLPDLLPEHMLLEPSRRNTAPCLAYASYKIRKKNPNACIIVTPADHIITNESTFTQCVEKAITVSAYEHRLVALGIQPTRPDTGYGYIQFTDENIAPGVKKVKTFAEKPDVDMAKQFLSTGEFLWNAGIFVWQVDAIIHAFETHLSEIADIFQQGVTSYDTPEETTFIQRAYSLVRNVSIDHGVMEKHECVAVVICDFGWSDLGSWESLYAIHTKDPHNNAFQGCQGIAYASSGNFVRTERKKLVIIDGLENYFVGDFDDVLVLCKRTEEAKFRTFVSDVRDKKYQEYL